MLFWAVGNIFKVSVDNVNTWNDHGGKLMNYNIVVSFPKKKTKNKTKIIL